ncbi:unnamed protein product [Sphagnum tenellum]
MRGGVAAAGFLAYKEDRSSERILAAVLKPRLCGEGKRMSRINHVLPMSEGMMPGRMVVVDSTGKLSSPIPPWRKKAISNSML